jgi:tetratricopeptide (TPR) repeat protein
VDPCSFILLPQGGTSGSDPEIARLQDEVKKARDPASSLGHLERLGWKFVSMARRSFDPGFYKLAEKCADCMESKQAGSLEALLLRGHVFHSLHRFREAESVARELVAKRDVPFDHGLLGDALMDQGRLGEAIEAYQKMIDSKPGLQSYARAAHVRWLKGDLDGARELLRMAVKAGSARDPESLAWAATRLAHHDLQAGDFSGAKSDLDTALRAQAEYAPALLCFGRLLLAEGKPGEALDPLRKACGLNPLPEYQWLLADSLRLAGRAEEARAVEGELLERGPGNDPRTFSLYLSTRASHVDQALRLAERELEDRADVFTWDALAWALLRSGKTSEALAKIPSALAEGTQDARLFLHAGLAASLAGQAEEARIWLKKAESIQQMLFPSERDELAKVSRS